MEQQPNYDSDMDGNKAGKIKQAMNDEGEGLIEHVLNELPEQAKKAYKEITGEDLLKMEFKEIACLLEPLFQQTGLACLAGSSDTGKSSLLRQLAVAIVTGEKDFLGFPIKAQHRSVIYVSTEDLERETAFLLTRQAQNYAPQLLDGLRFLFEVTDLLKELDERLTHRPADLVVIDCFADAFSGDLKDTQKIRVFLHPFQELAQKHQCLFLFLHHTGKRTENFEPNKNNLLSGQGFEAKMRVVVELRADLTDPAIRHLCIVKGNYLPASYKKESFGLRFDEESFTFSNTGDRTPFELLAKQQTGDNGKAKYLEAQELKEKGFTHEQIADKLGFKSKGSITKLFDRARKYGWDKEVSNVSSGNEEETTPF